ncbi:hypothetical protein IB229_18905 [Pseudomonas sp. PDM14]|nr:hypothetical protein [Pseudomonas sp. PDM14]
MPSHTFDEILGASAQTVDVILDPDEAVIGEAGMSEGLRFDMGMEE